MEKMGIKAKNAMKPNPFFVAKPGKASEKIKAVTTKTRTSEHTVLRLRSFCNSIKRISPKQQEKLIH